MNISPATQAFIDEQNDRSPYTADTIFVNQKEVFTKNGTPLYLLPSYGWDGGSGFSINMHNLEKFESIDVMGGPGAVLYRKIDVNAQAAAYYSCSGEDMAEVFIFP